MEAKGQRIDRYDLVAEIASGGMATVYLARLAGVGGFQRFVAIKRLHPHLAQEAEFVQMFLDEARLAAGIHHNNVVPILEVGSSDNGYYLVMEYIEGDTLARFLSRAAAAGERITPAVGVRIILDVLAGLHAAHEHRDEQDEPVELVHRDVSPQNILVGADGSTRLTDFGVARASTRLSATRVGQLKGKIAYMAPEQASGDASVDRRADIFSAGIVLWEVLTGRRLFKADNEAATLSRVISERVPPLLDASPDTPKGVADACMKALSRDPDDRFQDCAAFGQALEAAAQEAEILIPSKDVAEYVADVMGGALSQKREAVRAWLSRSEASPLTTLGPPPSSHRPLTLPAQVGQCTPVSSASLSATAVAPEPSLLIEPEPEPKRRLWVWLGGLLLLFGLGTGGWWAMSGGSAEEASDAPPSARDIKRAAKAAMRPRQLPVDKPVSVELPAGEEPAMGLLHAGSDMTGAEGEGAPTEETPPFDAEAEKEAPSVAPAALPPGAKKRVPAKGRSKKARKRSKPRKKSRKDSAQRPETPRPQKAPAEKPPPRRSKPALDLSNPYR